MIIQLIATTKKGLEALHKLSLEDTKGKAEKTIVNENPFTLEIRHKKMVGILDAVSKNPYVRPHVLNTITDKWRNILKKEYDISGLDFEVKLC